MKTKILSLIVLFTTLVSCVPSPMPISTETAIAFPSPTPLLNSVSATPERRPTPVSSIMPSSPCENYVPVSPTLKQITSDIFLVTLQYPANWKCLKADRSALFYSGTDGFFRLIAAPMLASTAKEVCESEVQHSIGKGKNRYGVDPTMEILQVDNRPACLVLPSDDQPKDQRRASLLVVEYPKSGIEHTRLLLLFADQNHVHDLISTLKFVQ